MLYYDCAKICYPYNIISYDIWFYFRKPPMFTIIWGLGNKSSNSVSLGSSFHLAGNVTEKMGTMGTAELCLNCLLQFYRNCWYWESSPPMVWSFWRSVELAENNESWSFRPWHGILRCRRFLHGGVFVKWQLEHLQIYYELIIYYHNIIIYIYIDHIYLLELYIIYDIMIIWL